jgi:hypothetical protein
MKYFLEEEEEEINGVKKRTIVKEVVDKAEAIKDKTAKKCYLHICGHDEVPVKPCRLEEI